MQTIRSKNITIFLPDDDCGGMQDPGSFYGEIQYQEDSSAIDHGIMIIDPDDYDHDLDLDRDYLIATD